MRLKIQDYRRKPFHPSQYVLDEGLQYAVELAIALGQPLLLTGEPGTGKTKLAYKVAYDLAQDKEAGVQFLAEPLSFYTKTTSAARDLFYTYDALGHFQSANIKREDGASLAKTADFVELQALGKAIALSYPDPKVHGNLLGNLVVDGSKSTVVLIDEIDKAPRDFPNDILNEIENLDFRIKELDNREFKHHDTQRIVVIMTSNSEKNLPDAFLRRCVFYHIPFPPQDQLFAIAKTQLGLEAQISTQQEKVLNKLIEYFYKVREVAVRKPPATAELIAWLNMMGLPMELKTDDLGAMQPQLLRNLSLLVKTREDLNAIRKWMNEEFVDWLN
jgi:MoxR-like ATPase